MTNYKNLRSTWLPTAALGIFAALTVSLGGCKNNTQPAPIVDNTAADGADPAAANMAPVDGTQQPAYSNAAPSGQPTRVLSNSQQAAPQQQAQNYPDQNYDQGPNGEYDQGYDNGSYQEADQPPPPLPEYEQPYAPGPNYLWTPGYWDYGTGGYYWVPGAWVGAPYEGALWTPGYWGSYNHRYRWHRGYWGRHIGYYGGINYGFGYFGIGYEGGYWNGNNFYYNRNVNRINVSNVRYVYERPVNTYGGDRGGRVAYNGPGGVERRPQAFELSAMREQHTAPMQTQVQVRQQAATNRGNFYATNHGRPAEAVSARPLAATPGIAAPPVRGGFAGRQNEPGVNGIQQQRVQQEQLRQQQTQQQQNQQLQNQHVQQQQTQQHWWWCRQQRQKSSPSR